MVPSNAQLVDGVVVEEIYLVNLTRFKSQSFQRPVAIGVNTWSIEWFDIYLAHTMAEQREVKLLSVQPLPGQRPLGLPHLWRMCVPVDFERHQHALSRVHVPLVQIGKTAHFSDAT